MQEREVSFTSGEHKVLFFFFFLHLILFYYCDSESNKLLECLIKRTLATGWYFDTLDFFFSFSFNYVITLGCFKIIYTPTKIRCYFVFVEHKNKRTFSIQSHFVATTGCEVCQVTCVLWSYVFERCSRGEDY